MKHAASPFAAPREQAALLFPGVTVDRQHKLLVSGIKLDFADLGDGILNMR